MRDIIRSRLDSLKNHAGFIRYFKNTSWIMGEQFLRIVASLFVGIWVARYLGPEQFGVFSYALAFTAIFSGIAKLGLDGILVREMLVHPEKLGVLLGTAFWLKVIGAFVVIGLIAIIVPFTSNDAKTNLFIFIISGGLLFQSFEVIEFYFQSQVLGKVVSICKVTQLLLSSFLKIYLLVYKSQLIWFVMVTMLDAVTLAAVYLIAYKLRGNVSYYKFFDLDVAKKLLRDSWPLIFSAVLVMIYMKIDQLMIKELLGDYEVGIYSSAVRLSESFYFIPMLLTSSLFPAIVNAKKLDTKLYKRRLQQLYSLMFLLAILISVPVTFISDWLVDLLFGEAYSAAGKVLVIHIWSSIFVFWGVASGKWFLVENLQWITLVNTIVGAVLNIILNFKFIPLYGVVGAAYTTVISFGAAAFLMNYFWRVSRENFYMLCGSMLVFRIKK